MSDEKIDRIDQRLTELVTITGNLVVAVRGLNEKYEMLDGKVENLNDKVENLNDKFDKLSQRVDTLAEDQKITNKKLDNTNRRIDKTNAILEDALTRIINLQKGQNEIIPRIGKLEERVDLI